MQQASTFPGRRLAVLHLSWLLEPESPYIGSLSYSTASTSLSCEQTAPHAYFCHLIGAAAVQVLLPPEAQHCRQLPHVLG